MTSNLKILQKLSDITKITAAKDGFSVVLISQSNDDMRPLIRQLIEKTAAILSAWAGRPRYFTISWTIAHLRMKTMNRPNQ